MFHKYVKREIKNFVKKSIRPKLEQQLNFNKDTKEIMVHQGIKCNKCNTMPINGIRYQCSVLNNINYCEPCEATVSETRMYPLIKVRDPAKAIKHQAAEVIKPPLQRKSDANEMIPLKSKCLNKDDYKNGIQVKAGNNFEVGWTFQNNGKKSWP